MDDHAGVNVFGHGFRTKAADFLQYATPEQSATPSEKSAVMAISSRLENSIEERLLIFEDLFYLQVLLKDVGIIEMMRCLDESYSLVLEKPDGVVQEIRSWDMIDIENRDDFSVGAL
jgi:hypothetical protein